MRVDGAKIMQFSQPVSAANVWGGNWTASPMEIRMSGFLHAKKGYQSNNGGFQLIFHLNMQKVKISKCVAVYTLK